jgi:hypothetical protein
MANYDFVTSQAQANRELPGAQVNNTLQPVRTSRYMEPYVQTVGGSKLHSLADEGTYFTATNATLGTALTGTAAPTAFSATVALMSLYNGAISGATGAKNIYLDWIQLEVRAAGTNGTNFNFAMSIDAGNRFTSGGTAITPVNTNINSNAATGAVLNVGALTTTAASASVRRAKHGQLRSVLKLIGDVYLFTFGSPVVSTPGMPLDGTLQAFIPVHCPPVVLGPNSTFLLHETAASQSVAATYEFSMGWWER